MASFFGQMQVLLETGRVPGQLILDGCQCVRGAEVHGKSGFWRQFTL